MNAGRKKFKLLMLINDFAAILIAIGVVILINALSADHFFRVDMSMEKYYSLSDTTKKLLSGLQQDIKIIVFTSFENELLPEIKMLLKNYAAETKYIKIEYVDPHRQPARSKMLTMQYDIQEPDDIIVDNGENRIFIPIAKMADYDLTPMLSGNPKVMKVFRGEQLISSAIKTLFNQKQPVVYTFYKNAEHRFDNFDPYYGYSALAKLLERWNIAARSFSFADSPAIPQDCSVLVIAGPKHPYTDSELAIFNKYLENGGRMLVLVDPFSESNIDKILKKWGVKLQAGRIIDKRTLTGQEILVNKYGRHPITEKIQSLTTIFYLPRSVEPIVFEQGASDASTDKPKVVLLAMSSPESWLETSPDENPPKYEQGKDRAGPLPVAVAIEKGSVNKEDVALKSTRIVVIGDSSFVANGVLMKGGGADFVLNAINWLIEREGEFYIPPKTPRYFKAILEVKSLQYITLLTIGVMPLFVLFVGTLVWLARKK
jgi:ABC-type uncharacterized transport system involved in gliding motility auxiliary subunit